MNRADTKMGLESLVNSIPPIIQQSTITRLFCESSIVNRDYFENKRESRFTRRLLVGLWVEAKQ